MNKILEALLIFVAVGSILLGLVFVIAGDTTNILTGTAMIIVGVVILVIVLYLERIDASKPTLVSQTFNVEMNGSGKFNERELRCKSCSAPLTDKNLKVVQGGIMVTCPYCGTAYALEEEPKW